MLEPIAYSQIQTNAIVAPASIAATGVLYLGCVRPKTGGSTLSKPIANVTRPPATMQASVEPTAENSTVMIISFASAVSPSTPAMYVSALSPWA